MLNKKAMCFIAIFLVGLACTCTGVSHAAEGSPDKADAGSWISTYEAAIAGSGYGLGLLGGYGVEIGDPPELDIAQVMPFVSFPLTDAVGGGFYRGVLEYRVEGVVGFADNWNQRGQLGISPVGFRYNFTGTGGRLVPFVEGMLGAVYINIPKTIQGTKFNFTESVGAGMRLFASDAFAVEVSGRFRHLSNAGIKKPNPGINTVFVLVGMSYY